MEFIDAMKFIDSLLENKTPEAKIEILRSCVNHALSHPWTDDDLIASICENIANEYKVPLP